MNRLTLTFAGSDYEHIRDLTRGDVYAEGIDLRYLNLQIEETFYRFVKFSGVGCLRNVVRQVYLSQVSE